MQRILCIVGFIFGFQTVALAVENFSKTIAPMLHEYCIDCHTDDNAEANVNLTQLLEKPDLTRRYRSWQQVAEMLSTGNMPPADMPQPSAGKRAQLVDQILEQLDATAREFSGQPGRVALRRLTNAEYRYTIEDLTGLQLDLRTTLPEDAAGGEGFANVGDVQFLQASILERYLEAAKFVAAHAVIGSGPLSFFPDPGPTGLELSAIDRIQTIYRKHGFRSAAGEGGKPFGLDKYPRALFTAWKYLNRRELGYASQTLQELAGEDRIEYRFVEHVLDVLGTPEVAFPLSEIKDAWYSIPPCNDDIPNSLQTAEVACHELATRIRHWQTLLAASSGDDEEAALLADDVVTLSPEFKFQADARWAKGTKSCQIELSLDSAAQRDVASAVVHWKRFTIRFRGEEDEWSRKRPFRSVLPRIQQARFGSRSNVPNAKNNDLVLVGPQAIRFDIQIPEGMTRADMDAVVQLLPGGDHIVRCSIADLSGTKETEADTGQVSALLGYPESEVAVAWNRGAMEFAKAVPPISHREAAPSDRDPIPPPYDNSYNNPERNDFHYKIKYHRNDRFLVDSILDESTREQLDQAWHDLLTSFDYHDLFFAFTKSKWNVNLSVDRVDQLTQTHLDSLSSESKRIVVSLRKSYEAAIASRETGENSSSGRRHFLCGSRMASPTGNPRRVTLTTVLRESSRSRRPARF